MKNIFVNFTICLFLLSSIGCENYSGPSGTINPYTQRQSPVVIGDPNRVIRPDENWTVLHQAADDQNFPLVKALVEQGADVRAKARQPWLAGGYGPYNQTPAVVALRWEERISLDISRIVQEKTTIKLKQTWIGWQQGAELLLSKTHLMPLI